MSKTLEQETLMDYTPSQEEEIARLKALAEKQTAQMQALLEDPIFQTFSENAKEVDRRMKEIDRLRTANAKITEQLQVVNIPTIKEPAENGYYIYTSSHWGWGKNRQIETEKSLLLKALGTWFNLTEGTAMRGDRDGWGKNETFDDFLDIESRTIEVALEKLEDETKYPHELLKVSTSASKENDEEDSGDDE